MTATYTEELGTYARFYTLDEARALILLLESNDIPFRITRETNPLESLIIGGIPEPMITVSIPPGKFQEVNQLVEDSVDGLTPEPNSLWEDTTHYSSERLRTEWIVFGYLLTLFPLIGILTGTTLVNSSKRLADGKKVKMYDKTTIRHGKYMLICGITFTLLWLTRRLYLTSL